MEELSTSLMNDWQNNGGNEKEFSVAEMVTQVASDVALKHELEGYVYCEEYGMYYNAETGYYYNPETYLFYNVLSQQYYYHNSETNSYEIYAVETIDNSQQWTSKRFRKRAERLFGKDSVALFSVDDITITELLFDLTQSCSIWEDSERTNKRINKCLLNTISDDIQYCKWNYESDDSEDSSDNMEELEEFELKKRREEEDHSRYPPCIRLLQFIPNRNPSLNIITITGAKIGPGKNCDIVMDSLPSTGIDVFFLVEFHSLENDEEEQEFLGFYRLTCCLKYSAVKQLNLCFNNSEITPNTAYSIQHSDQITLDFCGLSHTLVFHLHNGLNTCQNCELGLLLSSTDPASDQTHSKKNLEKERRRIMKQLKKSYGLEDEYFGKEPLHKSRKIYNSDNNNRRNNEASGTDNKQQETYKNCAAFPKPGCSSGSAVLQVDLKKKTDEYKPIESANKGFKLLQKMGWQEGKGLGKDNQGISGPIKISNTKFSLEKEESKQPTIKERILAKTKSRYYADPNNQIKDK